MLRSAVFYGWMESGARKRREEEKKNGEKKLVLSMPGSLGAMMATAVLCRLRGSSMVVAQEGRREGLGADWDGSRYVGIGAQTAYRSFTQVSGLKSLTVFSRVIHCRDMW